MTTYAFVRPDEDPEYLRDTYATSERVIAVARALAELEWSSADYQYTYRTDYPEGTVINVWTMNHMLNGKVVAGTEIKADVWIKYLKEAERFVAVFDVLSSLPRKESTEP